MPNLIRSPAILIVLLLTVYWAFGPHPTGKKKDLSSNPRRDKLVLRVPTKVSEPDAPLPPAKERRTGPARAVIRAQELHQLTSAPSQPADTEDNATSPIRATIRGIKPVPDDDPVAPPSPTTQTPKYLPQREPQNLTHVIVDGDTLKRLAAKYLGDSERFYDIFAANPNVLHRPDILPLGETLRIPVSD